MSFALSSGVAGLQAHQKMLDVAGNNLANLNTAGFKSSSVTFAEALSQTLQKASGATANLGGVNPKQIGTGVNVAQISRNMTQGSTVATGNDLDMAIEGEGFFTLNDGEQNLYTRIGSFDVDESNYLIDPATGYRVQRLGNTGEADGFQTVGDTSIRIPYDMAIPPAATTEFYVTGNLSAADASGESTATTLQMKLGTTYTVSGEPISDPTAVTLASLDQFSGAVGGDSISFTGLDKAGNAVTANLAVDATTTLEDLINTIETNFTDLEAEMVNGQIVVTSKTAGYTKSDIAMDFVSGGSADLEMPGYFEIVTAGGNDLAKANITIHDSQGGTHTASVSFVRTDTDRQWDMVVNSVTGDVLGLADRRIEGIQFTSLGEYNGQAAGDAGGLDIGINFAHEPGTTQNVSVNFGTAGGLDGITQFPSGGKGSTIVADRADGYAAGTLTSVSVDQEGMIVGTFSNGSMKNIAALQIGIFRNPGGMEAVGGGYFIPTANSGEVIASQALTSGAGSVKGKALEKSNVDTAVEFVRMMEAQNGYQANARTITVANEILKELTNLLR